MAIVLPPGMDGTGAFCEPFLNLSVEGFDAPGLATIMGCFIGDCVYDRRHNSELDGEPAAAQKDSGSRPDRPGSTVNRVRYACLLLRVHPNPMQAVRRIAH
jgi:hypothetical protein